MALSFTVPIIAVLITSPELLLSLIGQEYADGYLALIILSIGLIPFSVVTLAISKFNYLGKIRKLVLIGSLQVASFVLTFIIFTSGYGISGAAISVLISYLVPFFPCIVWSDRLVIRYTINSLIAITAAWVIGYAILIYNPGALGSIFAMALSAIISLVLVVALKNTSIREMRSLIVSISNSATRIRKDGR